MLSDKVRLSEKLLDDNDMLSFLYHIANEDRKNKHIWNISEHSICWEGEQALYTYLSKDFGKHHLYIAYHGDIRLGLFGMLNLEDCSGCANIIVWVDKYARKGLLVMKWFVYFLHEAQKNGITQWYARIKLANTVSLNSSKRYGFILCNTIPQHLIITNQGSENVLCVTRDTSFNSFEEKYIKRYLPNF